MLIIYVKKRDQIYLTDINRVSCIQYICMFTYSGWCICYIDSRMYWVGRVYDSDRKRNRNVFSITYNVEHNSYNGLSAC